MTKWSLFFEFMCSYVKIFFRVFYKHIQSYGKENIPHKKPMIFAGNHQNALMDPAAILLTNPNQSVFLTRADIFNNPILLKIFTSFKMLPVYRIRDGADSLKNNERIFNKSVEILEAKMSIALFPEATHTDKRRLRPLKKAVPRIAFMAEEKNGFNLDLQIVPVGIYYEDYIHSNSNLFINYGKPINIKEFKELYAENKQKAYNAFKEKLEKALITLIIHIEDEENYNLYEKVRVFYRSFMLQKLGLKRNNPHNNFKADKKTIELMHQFYSQESNNIEELDIKFNTFNKTSEKLGIEASAFVKNGFSILLRAFLYLIGLPIFVFGLINNYLYFYMVHKFVAKIKDKQFHTSIKFVITAFVSPILYLIHALILYAITGNVQWAIIYFVSLPITALFANRYRYAWEKYRLDYKLWRISRFSKSEYAKFIEQQNDLIELLNKVMGK